MQSAAYLPLKQSSQTRKTCALSLSDWLLLMTFPLLLFFFLPLVQFHRGMKSPFFPVLWHPESFSLCSLGEAANALGDTQKSPTLHLIVWQVHFMLHSHPESMFAKGWKKKSMWNSRLRSCGAESFALSFRQHWNFEGLNLNFCLFTSGAAFYWTFMWKVEIVRWKPTVLLACGTILPYLPLLAWITTLKWPVDLL